MTKPFLLIGLICIAMASVFGINTPQVEPEVTDGVYDRITSFADDHPDWRILQGDRVDTSPLRFGHQEHMSPDTPQMQERLQAWIDSLRAAGVPLRDIPVTRLDSGQLSLSCTACHIADAGGRYMQPISFESHCVQCHNLGEREGQPVPHGSEVGVFIERTVLRSALQPPQQTSRPGAGPAAGPPSGPPAGPGGPRRSGPPGRSGPPAAPAGAPEADATEESAPAAPSIEELYAQINSRITDQSERLARAIKSNCAKCHGIEHEITQIPNPHIPDRWLVRSEFNHQSHGMLRCDSCHQQATQAPSKDASAALGWTGRTTDIMLADINSCRTCHTPKGGAPHNCVLCHTYHPNPGATHEGGAGPNEAPRMTPEEFLRLEK